MTQNRSGQRTALLVVLLAFVPASCAPALTAVPRGYIDRLQQSIATVWPQMDRIWPGADFSRLTLLLVDGSNAYEINASGAIRRDYAEVSAAVPLVRSEFGYAKTTWNGNPTLAIRVSGAELSDISVSGTAVPALFAFATHEAFHYYVQTLPSWQGKGETNSIRATRYPIQSEPRILRYMLFRTLYDAYRDSRTGVELQIAAGLYVRWLREFSEEAREAAATDTAEGTAEYVTTVATARAAVGFSADEVTYRGAVLDVINQNSVGSDDFTSVDREAYKLGIVAGLLADAQNARWKQQVERGSTPLATLLQGVQPIDHPIALEGLDRLLATLQTRQRDVAQDMEPFLARFRDPNTVMLAVPFTALVGSFTTQGFFQTTALPYKPIIVPFSGSFRVSSGFVEINRVTVAVGVLPSCSGTMPHIIVPVASNALIYREAKLTVNGSGVVGTFEGQLTSQDGRSVFCVK